MLIQLGNLRSKVEAATPEELKWLQDFLQFEDAAARFRPGAQAQIGLYVPHNRTFPSGLLSSVVREVKTQNLPFSIEVLDARHRPGEPDITTDMSYLRDYQLDSVHAVWKRTRGILWLPTGAGKTTIAVGCVHSIPGNWLFCVNQTDLILQAAERYESVLGEKPGIIGDSEWRPDPKQRFTAATMQTLHARLSKPETQKFLAGITGLIVDEAHTLPAGTFWRVASLMPNAYWRVGLSGTPLARSDRRSVLVIAGIGDIIHRVEPQLLIERGYLSRPDIKMIQLRQTVPDHSLTYPEFRRRYVIDSKARNAAVMEAVDKVDKPALVFFNEKRHGRILKALCEARKWETAFVDGNDETSVRRSLIKQLEAGRKEVIVCSNVFTTGVDIPTLRGGVNAAGGKSPIQTLQRLGRGLRVVDGKTSFDWWDIADSGYKYFNSHTEERINAYRVEGYPVQFVPSIAGQLLADKDAKEAKQHKASIKNMKLSEIDFATMNDMQSVRDAESESELFG